VASIAATSRTKAAFWVLSLMRKEETFFSTLFHALNHAAIKTSILASGQLE
jgi:hypothetical protein